MTTKAKRPSFSCSTAALLAVPYSVTPGEAKNFDLTTSSQNLSSNSTSDPAYLFNQLKSKEWLHRYGLRSQKLTFDQILQQIGFKRVETRKKKEFSTEKPLCCQGTLKPLKCHCVGFDPVIGKTVSAKYAGNLYHEIQHDNGDRYVLTCRPDKLREYHHRLTRMLQLLRKRLLFLTNGSRRLFGMIGEPSVCLICDCKTFDYRLFNQVQTALTSLLKEQISKIKRFNIIWVSNDNEQFRERPVDVNSTNIDHAIDWICDRKCPKTQISISSTSEAILKAFSQDVHSIYLISEGDSSNAAREILRDNIVKTRLSTANPIPFHVISLFCNNSDTQTYLRSIAQSTDGTYFCYKIHSELSDLKSSSNLYDPTRIQVQNDKLQMGTNMIPPEQEYPVDISLMYKEIIQCQSVIDRIEKILGFIRDENQNPVNSLETSKFAESFNVSGENNFQKSLIVQSSALFNAEDGEMSSNEWLKIYGIDTQKLDFFSVLQSAAFRHCDGVITLLKPPNDSTDLTAETPANPQDKLINARYCDQFAHVAWPDGTIRHVHVTPELYRDYERRIKALLEKVRARLLWLKKGSRDVFGTVIENNIYILIDTSKSMEHHLGFVKEKLRLLIKDQLFAKERLNIIAFNSAITPWRDRLTKISDSMLSTQLQPWIDNLSADGSTNTLGALRFALADPSTEAIYLLSDGRPDQNERHILSQVQYRQVVPIHTIAFNCQDESANRFLYDLAKQTGGRFHAFQYGLEKETAIELPESEDVGNLKNELERGQKELERIAALRDECVGRAWAATKIPPKSNQPSVLPLKSQSAFEIKTRPNSSTMERRMKKKKSTNNKPRLSRRSKSADLHTGLNLNPNQWILPETKDFLNTNPTKHDPTKPIEAKSTSNKTPYDEVKFYLKRNSLLAKGLTIFDVLHPTTTTVRNPIHTQIIDRYVLAKVWDDLLSAAYGPYIKRLRLINHFAVDLTKYEEKLNDLIKSYMQFVSNFIWKHLNEDDRRKIGPSLHWNRLSKELQNQISQDISQEEHTSQSALEEFAWRKLSDDEQTALLESVPVYKDQNETILKSALKNSEDDGVFKGVKRMDLELQRARKFLQISTNLRQLQIRADVVTEAKSEQKPKRQSSSSSSSTVRTSRQRFLVSFDDDGFFYPGITKKNRHGREVIQFDMGLEQEIYDHARLPIGGAISQPHLLENDPVLVRQMNQKREFWVPGLVAILPSSTAQSTPLYTIEVYTPSRHEIDVPRRDLLRIPYNLFEQTRTKIQRLHNPTVLPKYAHPSSEPSIRDALRKELEPLTNRVEHLDKTHSRQYEKLKKRLDSQMDKMKALENSVTQKIDRSVSIPEISLKSDRTPIPSPKPSTRSKQSSRKSSSSRSSRPNDFIEINTEVFALWENDDALFYKGIIISEPDESNRYLIQRYDLRNSRSLVSRDDIYLDTQLVPLRELIKKPQTCILIEYPSEYRHCWAPAVILPPHSKSSSMQIRFYNCHDDSPSQSSRAIEITKDKFEKYSTLRIDFETQLLNQTIVGLNSWTNSYLLGTIVDRTDIPHEYIINWCYPNEDVKEPEDACKQTEEHLFGAHAWYNQLQVGDYVLAVDEQSYVYKPARVIELINGNQVNIRFLNSQDKKRQAIVDIRTAFVITEEYCQSAIQRLDP